MKVIKTWQQLAWRCMVADACQGDHNCSPVPYAFLLLSKIGCLKWVEKGFKSNFGVVAVFVLHVYSKMESCLEDLNKFSAATWLR